MSDSKLPSPPKPPLQDRLKQLLAEYGPIALWAYVGIFVLVLCGFALAIGQGWKTDTNLGTAGVWGAAYIATKFTQPLRITATLAVTPFAAALLRRRRRSSDTSR